jgi:hypothetical protein
MGKKFDAIYESVVSRGEVGGYLPGEYVVFRKGYKNTDTYRNMPTTLKKEVDELATCGLNIKVVNVGDKLSGASAGNVYKTASDVVLTIAADHGGGRTYGRVTVCPDMIDSVDYANGVPVPDQFKRKDQVIIKPKKLKRDPNIITNVTDKGNGKNTPTDLKLAGESKSWESTKELGMLYENMMRGADAITDRDRQAITQGLTQAGLDGNGRFPTVGVAINKLAEVLDNLSYSLDPVFDHNIPKAHYGTPENGGYKGQNLLTFRRKNMSEDPFNEEPEIENSRISFNWENLGGTGEKAAFEVVAYAS